MEIAGVWGGGVEEAILICPTPPLALSLIHGEKGSERWGVANTRLEVGTTGVEHVGKGGPGD